MRLWKKVKKFVKAAWKKKAVKYGKEQLGDLEDFYRYAWKIVGEDMDLFGLVIGLATGSGIPDFARLAKSSFCGFEYMFLHGTVTEKKVREVLIEEGIIDG
jgi:hypothetical protein